LTFSYRRQKKTQNLMKNSFCSVKAYHRGLLKLETGGFIHEDENQSLSVSDSGDSGFRTVEIPSNILLDRSKQKIDQK